MLKTGIRMLLVVLACVACEANATGHVVVIGHAGLGKLDVATLEKIYMGKVIEVNGIPVTAINANSGSDLRNRFLHTYLNRDEDGYTAYWTVRRYIGKGAPPREFSNSADVIDFIKSTTGAIGYVDEAEVPPGVKVLLK